MRATLAFNGLARFTHYFQQSDCFTTLKNIVALRKALFLSEYFEKNKRQHKKR